MSSAKLFERMRDPELIEGFLKHRSLHPNPGMDIEAEEAYIRSAEYLEHVSALESGDYFLGLPIRKEIPKSLSNKKRTVYCFSGKEKLLLQAMSYALHIYDERFPDCVYSSILGKSFKAYIQRMKNDASFGEMYAVKVDISGYGASIDTDMLVEKLEAFFKDDIEAFSFFKWILERRDYISNGVKEHGDMAAIPGIPIHSFFTNLYILDMDLEVQSMCTGYCRYSDDILGFSATKEDAERLMKYFRSKIEGAHLRINEEKTSIYEPHSRFDHMGICYIDGRIDLSDYALYKLKRKMRIRAKRLRRQVEDRRLTPEDGTRLLIRLNHQTFFGKENSRELCWSRWLFPMLTEHAGLHELDLYNQRAARYVMTGKWSDSAYRVSYEKLKELGYESLVRRYYEE